MPETKNPKDNFKPLYNSIKIGLLFPIYPLFVLLTQKNLGFDGFYYLKLLIYSIPLGITFGFISFIAQTRKTQRTSSTWIKLGILFVIGFGVTISPILIGQAQQRERVNKVHQDRAAFFAATQALEITLENESIATREDVSGNPRLYYEYEIVLKSSAAQKYPVSLMAELFTDKGQFVIQGRPTEITLNPGEQKISGEILFIASELKSKPITETLNLVITVADRGISIEEKPFSFVSKITGWQDIYSQVLQLQAAKDARSKAEDLPY